MASYTGNKIKDTYQSIVKAIDNDEIGATDKQLTDGVGNELGLHVNTDGDLRVEGDLRVDGAIKDSLNSPGTDGQVLKSTLTGTDWVDVSSIAVQSITPGAGIDADASQGDVTISLNTEDFQDIIGAMVSGNSESNITVTYDDTNGKLNFSVPDLGETYTADEVTLNLNGDNQFNIANGGVDTTQIASNAVTDDKIAADSVGASELKVSSNGFAGEALTSDGDGTFSWSSIVNSISTDLVISATGSTGNITLSIPNGAIDTTQIANDAITDAKIAANSVGASELKISTNGNANESLVSDGDGTFSWLPTVTSLDTGGVLNITNNTGDITISLPNNSIGADQLDVAGNGNPGQYLISDGYGSFNWITGAGGGATSTVNLEVAKDFFTGTGSKDTHTISKSVDSVDQISIYYDGVYQNNDDGAEFSVSGTSLTFTTAPDSGVEVEIVTLAPGSDTLISGSGTIYHFPKFSGTHEIEDSSVTESSEILGINLTGAIEIPIGTTAERPSSPSVGMIRYNSTTSDYELYDGSNFVNFRNIYTAGNGISETSNVFTVIAGDGLSQDTSGLSHDNTSSQASITPTTRTYITGVTLDTFGHVTGLSTGTETATDTTYTATGNGLDQDGTVFTHADTSSASSVTESARRYIKSVTLDEFGHVTALTTGTETVTDTTYSASGNGLDQAGTVFSHADTSTLSNTANSGRTYIQNVTVDEFGHLTGVTTATETAGEGTTYTAGSGLDLSGSNVFSVEPDLRDGITHIGLDSSDYINFVNNTRIDFFVNGTNEMQLKSNGELHVDGDIIAFSSTTSSDERLKDNIRQIESATDKIKQIRGVEFTWKKNGKNGGGVIAQDVEKVLPGAVKEVESLNGQETYKAVDYNSIIGLLIETNKELLERIEKLENKG